MHLNNSKHTCLLRLSLACFRQIRHKMWNLKKVNEINRRRDSRKNGSQIGAVFTSYLKLFRSRAPVRIIAIFIIDIAKYQAADSNNLSCTNELNIQNLNKHNEKHSCIYIFGAINCLRIIIGNKFMVLCQMECTITCDIKH